MGRETKESIEARQVNYLIEFLHFQGKSSRGVEPAPDFLWEDGRKIIGVEHTRLFAEPGKGKAVFQAKEALIEKICEAVHKEYVRRGLPPIEAKLHLGPCFFSKAGILDFAKRIVELVAKHLPPEVGRCWIDLLNEPDLPQEINSIGLIRFANQTGVTFFAPRGAWITPLASAKLQQTISEKAKRLPGYLTRCNEVWLLLAAAGETLSTTYELSNEVLTKSFDDAGFTRLYLLHEKTIYRLRTGRDRQIV